MTVTPQDLLPAPASQQFNGAATRALDEGENP
jgi:hypothetical protein